MFKKKYNNLVESNEGYSVKILGRAGIQYREGSKIFYIDSEIECGLYDIVVYKKRIRDWESPIGSYEPIAEKKRDEIVANICQALLFLGYIAEVEDSY